ncbi:MAG: hypothetical protein LZ174_10530, partial [Thaumarchaeota archaeon]|jgi:hypothetical protein|nr:hypothetical protein [Candidatus Geocrenenecus arthurdayi]
MLRTPLLITLLIYSIAYLSINSSRFITIKSTVKRTNAMLLLSIASTIFLDKNFPGSISLKYLVKVFS